MTHAYVKDIMTAGVVAVTADAPYRNLAAMFRLHRVSGFPVVDADGKVVGVVSETDLLAACLSARPRPRPRAGQPGGRTGSSRRRARPRPVT